ncbi:MAG: sugar phosphate isomerase/epimerase [Bacteroidetes bacterium]|nr:sugar phosphate isomerase/epimerase [Bacteroidota bacterium]MDA1122063.1 sugar phosphate isomerase/epimerase [Bacteroidota bacterium]
MGKISLGAEVYTWFMSEGGKTYENQLGHMIEMVAKSGFTGIEPMHFWMGDWTDPVKLADKLDEHNIQLAGLALALDWNNSEETEEERRQADNAIELIKHFPGAVLCTVQLPSGRHDLEQRRLNLVANVNSVSKRAAIAGIKCSFHPNSPESSTNRTAEDYNVILNGLDDSVTGWTPDVGHIRNGGMDILEKMEEFKSLINHVHYKDWDGAPEWALMGKGKIDFEAITNWLVDENYEGWILCEDEADAAITDPDGVTLHDGKFCQERLLPIIS